LESVLCVSNMSVLQLFPPKLQAAVKELRKIQQTRIKDRMERKIVIGDGRTRIFNSEGDVLQQNQGEVFLTNICGGLFLCLEPSKIHIPCDSIQWYSCVDNTITFELADEFWAKKIILELESIEQVNMIICKVRPPEKPKADTYLHDGNVTSSDTDSDDSCRGKTGGVDNSFDSDSPSSHESF
ncbi:hypothetical protein AMK59_521, partial [Oryctes borbonicus]